jgi:GNAT superfamily N-acetyltransferase
VPPPIATRRATLEDVDSILAQVQAGFDSYTEFAPPGWSAPRVAAERERTAGLLADPGTWALLALADGAPVGHVSFYPARERSLDRSIPPLPRPLVPGLAHFWQLFVLPRWWGQGVAPVLHAQAIAEIHARGFDRAQLFTPSLHRRARRFYERRSWSLVQEEWNDDLELTLCEYQLALA